MSRQSPCIHSVFTLYQTKYVNIFDHFLFLCRDGNTANFSKFLKFFKKSDNTLPDAESPAERSANKCVQNELSLSTPSRKRKRGEYGEYSPETRYKIARYAIENGNSRAARHFSSVLDKNINESTVRGFKVAYNRRRNLDKDFEQSQLVSLPRSSRGRPTKLGKYDEFVQSYVRKLRKTGGIVNSRIIISAAKGFLIAEDRTLLAENGGPITLTKHGQFP